MRKLIVLFSLLLAVGLPVSAKLTQFILRGWIEKQDYTRSEWRRESVDSVYVDLMMNDTIPVQFKLLRGDDAEKMATGGELRALVEGGVGNYSLVLTRDGYEPLRHEFKVASEAQDIVYLRSLSMEARRENELNEVEVLGTAIKMVMKGDTIVYDSRAFKLAEGSTLDALVRQLPGAELADDGSITVNGKKVNSLLLNGNDFFNGDPDVALKNLPSYTVDKIKVYDKAAKDDNVTLASHRLADTPDAENLVMDVVLKKEFSMATIVNVEGGYGPGIYTSKGPKKYDNRYIGRGFVIGFGKNYRWSAFGNVNNIKNTSKSSSANKDWGWGSWSSNGDMEVAMGGFDVFYNPTKKWEISADMQYSKEDYSRRTQTAATRFYETGNLYARLRTESDETRNHLIANASLRYMGDNLSVYLRPRVDWLTTSSEGCEFVANFDREPFEASRNAAIDSLFLAANSAEEASEALRESVTSATYQSYNGSGINYPDNLNFSAYLSMEWRPKKARGRFSLSGNVDDSNKHSRYGRMYVQPFVADADASPIRREQWSDNDDHDTNASAELSFDWNKRNIGEKWMKSFSLRPAVKWSMERQRDEKALMVQKILENMPTDTRPLPSVTAPENISPLLGGVDGENTVSSLFLNNRIEPGMKMSFNFEPVAPSDSGINPAFGINVNYTRSQHFRYMTYAKPYMEPEPFDYTFRGSNEGTDAAGGSVGFSSNNKTRYLNLYVSYNYSSSLLNLFTLLPTVNSSNPTDIYVAPENGSYKTPQSHSVWLNSYYYNTKTHHSAYAYVQYRSDVNNLGYTSVFNPATGVTVHQPVSVNGNWQLYSSANYHMPFGPGECWHLGVSARYNHSNSVDYISSVGAPVRSLVRNDEVTGELSLSYKLKNGTSFSIGGDAEWQYATSPRADFSTINAWEYNLEAGINFYLPWQIEGETTLDARFRRGYQDSALNTTEWIWNASVQKTFLKGNMTVKINAVDLLGQLSTVWYYVNAQGRTETWSNSLPRYVMLTLAYRFNFTPKALKAE